MPPPVMPPPAPPPPKAPPPPAPQAPAPPPKASPVPPSGPSPPPAPKAAPPPPLPKSAGPPPTSTTTSSDAQSFKNASTATTVGKAGNEADTDADCNEAKTKLKPFFWDKVPANPDQSMMWDHIKSGSFQFNEEIIESLFGYNSTDKKSSDAKKDSHQRMLLSL